MPQEIVRVSNMIKEVSRSVDVSELGVTGGLTFSNFISGETINIMPVSYSELKRMTDEDGQARSLLSLLTLPLKAAKWDIFDEDGGVKNGVVNSSPEREFIHEMLFKPASEGGMTVPFSQIIATMALAVRDGFKIFEKVFALNDRGRVVLKKLAKRDNDTVSLLADDHGDYSGCRQRTYFNGRMIDIVIGKEKSLLFVFGKEENQLYGAPVFMPVYYHADKKHKLYYISHVAFQVLAIPPRIGKYPSSAVGNKDVKDKFLRDLASIGLNSAMIMPEGFSIDKFESTRSLIEFIPLIDHHDAQMAKAVLGQFINLAISATGKLLEGQADFFILGLKSILMDMEEVFNTWVIPQAIDFNFRTQKYPKLRSRPFTDREQNLLTDIFKALMTAGADKATPEFLISLEKKMAGQLEIKDINYDELSKRAIAEHKQKQQMNQQRMDALSAARASGGNPNASGGQNAPGDGGFGQEGNQ